MSTENKFLQEHMLPGIPAKAIFAGSSEQHARRTPSIARSAGGATTRPGGARRTLGSATPAWPGGLQSPQFDSRDVPIDVNQNQVTERCL